MTSVRPEVGVWAPPANAEMLTRRELRNTAHAISGEIYREVMVRMAPHRRTGRTARTIRRSVVDVYGQVVGGVSSDSEVMRYLEEGTGEFGPRGQRIYPPGKAFNFPASVGPGTAHRLTGRARSWKSARQVRRNEVFTAWIRGIRPLHIFRDAGVAVQPRATVLAKEGQRQVHTRLAEAWGVRRSWRR